MQLRSLVNNFHPWEMFSHLSPEWSERGNYSVGLCSEEWTDQTVVALWLNPAETWKCGGGGETPLNESSLISASPAALIDHLLCEGEHGGIAGKAAGHGKAFLARCNFGTRESWGRWVVVVEGSGGWWRGQEQAWWCIRSGLSSFNGRHRTIRLFKSEINITQAACPNSGTASFEVCIWRVLNA